VEEHRHAEDQEDSGGRADAGALAQLADLVGDLGLGELDLLAYQQISPSFFSAVPWGGRPSPGVIWRCA